MALPEIRGIARLLTDPRTGATTNGNPYTSALVLFETWTKDNTGTWQQGEGVPASVITYDVDTTHTLTAHTKGDKIGIHGTTRPDIYNNKPQLKITATRCWTPQPTPKDNP